MHARFAWVLLLLLAFSPLAAPQGADSLPLLGVNIEGPQDWNRQLLFADAMKQSRGWGSAATPWDLNTPVDANGWPTGDAGVVVLSGGVHIDGTYHLSFTGQATVRPNSSNLTVQNVAYNAATNTTTADVVVAVGERQIMLSFTGTHGGVRNVLLMRPGYTNETFTTPFLNLIRPYVTLRFMQYAQIDGMDRATLGNPVVHWSDRTLPTSATQNRQIGGARAGGAWEYAIQLANQLHKDLWVNIPDQADDDYVTQFATMLRDHVDPSLHIYVEWSNEVWNYGYAQATRNRNAAIAEVNAGGSPLNWDGSTNQGYWAWRRVGKRIKEVSDRFRAVFGDAAMMTRVRPVLATQLGQQMTLRQPLEFIDHTYGLPSRYLYAVAGAPYFGLDNATSALATLTVDQIFAALPASIAQDQQQMVAFTAWAHNYGLRHFCYEGGPGLTGAASLAAKDAANRDPRMTGLIEQHLTNFFQAGGDQFVYYTDVSGYGQYGFWGLTDDITVQDTVKTQALAQVQSAGRPAVTAGFAAPGTINAADATVRDFPVNVQNDPAGGNYLQNGTNGAFAMYLVRVPAAGNCTLTVRVGAMNNTGRLEVLVDGNLVQSVNVPSTGGQTTWQNVPAGSAQLSPGLHVVRLRFATAGFSIKSLSVGQ